MKVLIAEDSVVSRRLLEGMLVKVGYTVSIAINGDEAWKLLEHDPPPRLVLLDWMMPGLDGVDLCRQIRRKPDGAMFYLVLLTARKDRRDVIEGFDAGADDYLTKPYFRAELEARIRTAARIVRLQLSLAAKIHEMEEAYEHVRTLQGIIPLCMHCRKIQSDQEAWEGIEAYVEHNSNAQFSHSVCPECQREHYSDMV